jgi:hypothetical protein
MNFVDVAIRNARLTLAALLFLIVAGTMSYINDSEGSRAGHPDSDHLCEPALFGHFAGGFRAAAAPAGRDASSRTSRASTDASNAYQGGGNVVIEFMAGADLSTALDDVRNKVRRQARPAAGHRRTVGQRGQYLRIPGSGRHACPAMRPSASDARRQGVARPDRGSLRRARCLAAGCARRSGRSDHRSGQAVLLRYAARPADRRRQCFNNSSLSPPVRWKARKANMPSRFRCSSRPSRMSPTCRSSARAMRWCAHAISPRSARPSRTRNHHPAERQAGNRDRGFEARRART